MPLRIPFLTLLILFAGAVGARAQAIHSLAGHDSAVFALAFRPDSRQLATGSFDCTIKLWDTAGGRMQHTLSGHVSQVSALAYSPDGNTLASADTSGAVLLWRPEESSLPRRLEGHPLCTYAVAFAPDGQTLWTCSQDHKIKIWSVSNGELLRVLGPFDTPLYALALSNDGRSFAVAGLKGELLIGNVVSGQTLDIWSGNGQAIFALAFSPDGRLAAAGQDGQIRIWGSGGAESSRLEGHRDSVYQIGFSATGRRLTSVSTNGLVVVWDAVSGTALFSHRFPGKTYAALLSPDGGRLAVGGADGETFWMDLPTSAR